MDPLAALNAPTVSRQTPGPALMLLYNNVAELRRIRGAIVRTSVNASA
jgi:hypothetical protein